MESYCHKAVILLTIYNLLHQSALGMPLQTTDLDFSPQGFLQFFLAGTRLESSAVRHESPAAFAVFVAPKNCPVNQKVVNGSCRPVV
jgi:hypothetical protein